MTLRSITNFFRYTKIDPILTSVPVKPIETLKHVPEQAHPRALVQSIFSPHYIPTRLIVKDNLFSSSDEAVPIKTARSDKPFHNLQVRERSSEDELVLEDATTGKPKVAIVRYVNKSSCNYHIYTTSPVYKGQEPISRLHVKYNERLYSFAKVEQWANVLLAFVPEGSSDPCYTVHKAGATLSSANYLIKDTKGKTVASTHKWDKNSQLLEVSSGTDGTFMLCLVAIADEMTKTS